MNSVNIPIGKCIAALVSLLVASTSYAQDNPIANGETTAMAQTDSAGEATTTAEEKIAQMAEKLRQLEEQAARQQEQTDALKAESDWVRNELEVASMQRDDLQTQIVSSVAENEGKFNVYGFMDVNFFKTKSQTDGSVVYGGNPTRYNSFFMNNVNLYFSSRMTSILSALAEIRFTFSPLGNTESVPSVIYNNRTEVYRDGEYRRTRSSASEPFGRTYNLGGIQIERAYFDVKPKDWFGIRAGRFFTPYGIWNEDHSPTVCLTVLMPFLQILEYVPTAQTGVMAFGELYPADALTLQYAVTLSNGRSPMEAYYDMDDNKALGLRGKLTVAKRDFKLSVGGYGYYGKYTDWTQEIQIYMTPQMELDPSRDPALLSKEIVVQKYKELIGVADVELTYKGLRLAGEFVWRKVEYSVPPLAPYMQALFLSNDPTRETYEGNKIARSGYALLSYTLPLDLKVTTVTPFTGIDMFAPNDAMDYDKWLVFQAGVNVKPGAYLTLKASGYVLNPSSEQYGGYFFGLAGQAAVSF